MNRSAWRVLPVVGVALWLGGCVLAPRETTEERLRLDVAGGPWTRPAGERALPDVAPDADWPALLQHALLASGELEAAFLDWKVAVERIDAAAGWPNTNLTLGYQYLFSGGNLKGWDRSTLTVGTDPMQNLAFPTKVMAAGEVALADARAAGHRFFAAKFELQEKVLDAWLEWALLAEKLRLQREEVALLTATRDASARAVVTGGMQTALLSADADVARAQDTLAQLEAEVPGRRATLNALVGRRPDAPLTLPVALPAPRPLPADDARLLAAGAGGSPQIRALAWDVAGREHAIDLARQQWIPDLNPFAGVEGSMAQWAGVIASLPARVPMILSGIHEARTMLQRSEAVLRQARLDRDASLIATVAALRDAERQERLARERLLPLADATVARTRDAYVAATVPLPELLAAERMRIEVRTLQAEAHVARETRLAELETLLGTDVETLDRPRVAVAAAGGAS